MDTLTPLVIVGNFNQAVDVWLTELEQYDMARLCSKPSPANWSLGQLYMHLIEATGYFTRQVRICAANNENETGEVSAIGRAMFNHNSFPDALLDGPPSNAKTQQPTSKEQLKSGLLNLKKEMVEAGDLAMQTQFRGKTKHFGLGYFTAAEWLQFADMHLRHHFRQKKRIDEFLKTSIADNSPSQS